MQSFVSHHLSSNMHVVALGFLVSNDRCCEMLLP
jgi:hypothetical protein